MATETLPELDSDLEQGDTDLFTDCDPKPLKANKSLGNMLNPTSPRNGIGGAVKHVKRRNLSAVWDLLGMQKEGDEASIADSAVDGCFLNLNNSDDNSSVKHCGKSVMTLHKEGVHEGVLQEGDLTVVKEGGAFYELSFNNSTHFLNNLACDSGAPNDIITQN